jgi:hypothetical protein
VLVTQLHRCYNDIDFTEGGSYGKRRKKKPLYSVSDPDPDVGLRPLRQIPGKARRDLRGVYPHAPELRNLLNPGRPDAHAHRRPEHALLPNQFILIAPGVSHGAVYDPDEPKRYAVFVFGIHRNSETLPQRRSPENEFIRLFQQTTKDSPYIVSGDLNNCGGILSEMEREATEKRAGWQVILTDYCECSLSQNNTQSPQGRRRRRRAARAGQANLAVAITKYMHEHYHENISLEDVSKAFHITPRHVTRIFSEYFGTGFRKTLSVYRLNYAKKTSRQRTSLLRKSPRWWASRRRRPCTACLRKTRA